MDEGVCAHNKVNGRIEMSFFFSGDVYYLVSEQFLFGRVKQIIEAKSSSISVEESVWFRPHRMFI